jgi:SMODS-associated and fused to various effectors sensor domain
MLAESVVQKLRAIRKSESGIPKTHIFIAGPNGFAFFLGQHHQAIGPAFLYEWDFDRQRGGGYGLGLSVGEQPL